MGVRFPPGLSQVQDGASRPTIDAAGSSRHTAVSSRGLGHSPLKAGTRVRIPLPLLISLSGIATGRSHVVRAGTRPHRLSVRTRPFQGRETGSIPVGATRLRGRSRSHVAGRRSHGGSAHRPGRGRSSVWLEHSTVTREVAGSSPVAPVRCLQIEGAQRVPRDATRVMHRGQHVPPVPQSPWW